jgi:excisionase family DNA binding protein
MQPKLISVGEVADVLGVSIQTIYSWVSKGRLPFVKVGRRTLFQPVEIERWIEARSRKENEPGAHHGSPDARF